MINKIIKEFGDDFGLIINDRAKINRQATEILGELILGLYQNFKRSHLIGTCLKFY